MHATSGFSWWIDGLRYYLLFGVPALMLVILFDAARRSAAAFKHGRTEQVFYGASALVMAALLAAGLLWPHVSLFGLAAVLMIPGSLVFGGSYLLRVVYRMPVPEDPIASAEDVVPSIDPTEES